MKKIIIILFFTIPLLTYSQDEQENSLTRKFIDRAEFIQVNKDWNVIADFQSGLGEIVSFFPVESIDLKTNEKVKSLQIDMSINAKQGQYFKSSWVDLDEVEEFIIFIETYVIPNLSEKTDFKQSVTYIFNSKEMAFRFYIEGKKRRISIYLKDFGIIDNEHYFWTETQVKKIPDLLNVLKQIK